MVNNIKTEIIYYQGPTDFEFEFNLNGSCQMRLLTNVANDSSSLLKALQKSISRSKVILIIGNIYGDDGIISLTSKSIGYAIQNLDADLYNIGNAQNAAIIEGSVPLITNDGEFGGCIIESGPQSMIFLTEDKNIRKQLMNQLVHTYINELSKYSIPVMAENNPPINEDLAEPELNEEEETGLDNAEEIIEDEETENIASDDTAEEINIKTAETMIAEPEENDPYIIDNLVNTESEFEEILESSSHEEEYSEDDEEAERKNIRRLKINKALDITSLILAFLILVIAVFLVYSFIYRPINNGITIEENFWNTFSFLIL